MHIHSPFRRRHPGFDTNRGFAMRRSQPCTDQMRNQKSTSPAGFYRCELHPTATPVHRIISSRSSSDNPAEPVILCCTDLRLALLSMSLITIMDNYVKLNYRYIGHTLSTHSKKPLSVAAQGLGIWCGRGDLNPHGLLHYPLKIACLPIPPLPPCRDFVNESCRALPADLPASSAWSRRQDCRASRPSCRRFGRRPPGDASLLPVPLAPGGSRPIHR